jgi:DNA-binding NtrC family response regulator
VLLEHFLREFSTSFAKPFRSVSAEAVDAAMRYSWPGNIRELRNCLERAVLLHEGEVLSADMLQIPGVRGPAGEAAKLLQEVRRIEEKGIPDAGVPFEEIVASLEQYLIRKASEKAGWNQSQAARYLRLNRDKLRTRMKTYRFTPKHSS